MHRTLSFAVGFAGAIALTTASHAGVLLSGSQTTNTNLSSDFVFNSQSVQAGDLIVVAQAGNKTPSQGGGQLTLDASGTAALGAINLTTAAAEANAGSNLFYAPVTGSGSLSLTLGAVGTGGNTSSVGLFVLRSDVVGQSLAIEVESFADSDSPPTQVFTFTFPADAIVDSGNFALTTLSTSNSSTGGVRTVSTTGFTAAQTSGGGSDVLRALYTLDTAASTSPFVVSNTISDSSAPADLPDFSGIGAVAYAVPEPASLALLGLGGLLIGGRRTRN